MKYINKQKHARTCGPVALVNAYRKFNRQMSYKKAIRLCGGSRVFKRGTTTRRMLKVLKDQGFDATYLRCSFKDARYFAKFKEFAVIATHWWETKHGFRGHFTMLDTNGNFVNNGKVKRYKRSIYKDGRKTWNHKFRFIVIRNK